MTFSERLQQEYPDSVGPDFTGGCSGCPLYYGYESPKASDAACEKFSCSECWEREIPEPGNNLLKIDTIVEGIPEQQPDKITRKKLHEMLDLLLDINEAGNCVSFCLYGLYGYAPGVSASAGVQFGAYEKGKGFDYYKSFEDFDVELFAEAMKKLREIKNAPDAGTSKGSIQMDIK